jgi:membrane protease YdiL (CAAX protease family)
MPLFAELSPDSFLLPAACLAIAACITVWVAIAARWWVRRPLLPYQPRRQVPWQAVDLALVAAFNVVVLVVVAHLAVQVLGQEATKVPTMYDANQAGNEHMVARLLAEGNPWILVLCAFSVAIVAPVAEEFLFRVMLQGWLESLEHRWRRRLPTLRRIVPRAFGPIVLTAFLFARLHFRVDSAPLKTSFLLFTMLGESVASLLTVAFAMILLRWNTGATPADLGWVRRELSGDILRGLAAFAAVAAPIYAAQYYVSTLLPKNVAPDPFVLFFFALALGILYFRTHRIVPSIVLHASLNATTLVMFVLLK